MRPDLFVLVDPELHVDCRPEVVFEAEQGRIDFELFELRSAPACFEIVDSKQFSVFVEGYSVRGPESVVALFSP